MMRNFLKISYTLQPDMLQTKSDSCIFFSTIKPIKLSPYQEKKKGNKKQNLNGNKDVGDLQNVSSGI